jgi:hypothetical protein
MRFIVMVSGPLQHVEELRELIQARFAKRGSDQRNAGIAAQLLRQSPFLGCLRIALQQPLKPLIGVGGHGPEFEAVKSLSVESDSSVAENRRSGRRDHRREVAQK